MTKLYLTLVLGCLSIWSHGQSYFPPLTGTAWDTLSPTQLGWCQDRIDSLYQFLDDKNSKSFIVLKDGEMVLEKYFDDYTRDSVWYWASAGKSLAAVLVGIAQSDGMLDIEDPVSNYLGQGWTALTPAQEAQVKIRHQISMTTGFEWQGVNLDCLDDSCLTYRTAPDSQWYYHNAPYRLVLDVLENSSGMTINQFTLQKLGSRIGMGGLWFNYVRFGKARDMARFGLLCLNNGVWDGDTLVSDSQYFADMSQSSNPWNASYGYLWWLNGKGSFIQPGLPFTFSGDIVPSAPADMYAAMGKDDQRIYVVPSMDMVVVRQGPAADSSTFALSNFDDDLWQYINALPCAVGQAEAWEGDVSFGPNPVADRLRVEWPDAGKAWQVELWDLKGLKVGAAEVEMGNAGIMELEGLAPGMYLMRVRCGDKLRSFKVLKS